MFRYIIDRVIALFITLFIIVSIAFCVVRLMPGSVYDQDGDLSQTVIDTLNEKYHFDEPIIKQYGYFLKNVFLHGDWGTSMKMRPNVPVFEVMKDRIPVTLQINLISLFAAIPIGLASRNRGGNKEKYDHRPLCIIYGGYLHFSAFIRICHMPPVFCGI